MRKTQVQISAQFISYVNLNNLLVILGPHSFFLDKREIIKQLNEGLPKFPGT